jgi:iron complex transport system substrate-binding protein
VRAVAAVLLAAALGSGPAAAADARRGETPAELLRPRGQRLAEGGPLWIGPRPTTPPRRVIVLAPNLTDVIPALGAKDRLVGVTTVDDDPEVKHLPRVGGFIDPNPEAILALRPDLVLWVTDGGALAAVRRLAELSLGSTRPFPIVALDVVSVADVLATPRAVGDALGLSEAGARLSSELAAAVERVRRRAAGLTPKRALFLVAREPLVVAGPGSFPDELLAIAACENVVRGERPWPVFSLERAVALNPDVVVDGAPREPANGIRRLAAIPAVRRGAVIRLETDDLLRPGPKMIRALEPLFLALHPEAR